MKARHFLLPLVLLATAAEARPGEGSRDPGGTRRSRGAEGQPSGRRVPSGLSASDLEALIKRREEPRLTWAPYDFLEKGLRTAPWVKDPFFPEGNGFKLSGVISTESAFINGRWYRQGEVVDGFVVKEINPTGVTLTRRSEIVVLKLDQ